MTGLSKNAVCEGALLNSDLPNADCSDAERLAAEFFGKVGQAKLLSGEKDLNFHIRSNEGAGYVLKISNSVESPLVADMQNEALLHIERQDSGLAVPRVQRTVTSSTQHIHVLDGHRHIIRLLSYLPGKPLHETAVSVAQLDAQARYLARLGLALKDFSHPAADHTILWDIKRADTLRPIVSAIRDLERQKLVLRAIDGFMLYAQPHQMRARSQVIHNDFNPHNILVDPAHPDCICGVIDFGDLVHTALINDVATAASYYTYSTEHPLAAAAQFLAAYHQVNPLLCDEVDVLFDLIAVRHAMLVAITEWRAARYPENRDYICKNTNRAALGLAKFAQIPRIEAINMFRHACNME